MEIRSILLALNPRTSSASNFGPALDLAQRFGARVSVCAAALPRVDITDAQLGLAAADEYTRQRREIDEGLTSLEAAFETTVPATMRGRYLGLIAPLTDCLLGSMASTDLVLLPGKGLRELDIGELIVSGGRPVVALPENATQVASQHIVVAWKDTREARRAVADALPFLKAAEDVFMVSVEESDFARVHESFKDVMAWLKTHDVKVNGDIVPLRTTVRDAIEEAATEKKAGFIVSGGYGHTRFREWMFGGVTRDLLASTTRCRFFSN